MQTVLSLFSGCGGFDSGFLSEGMAVKGAFDNDLEAVKTYNRNFPAVAKAIDLTVELLPKSAPDIVLAGPPCQGFSTIGPLQSDDARNDLLRLSCEIAVRQKPKLFILENVPAVTSEIHRSRLEAAVSVLSSAGFWVERTTIHCDQLGLPQRRKRFFLFARRGNRPFNVHHTSRPLRSVGEALANLYNDRADTAVWLPDGSHGRAIAERIGSGQKLSNVRLGPSAIHTWQIPDVFGQVTTAEIALLEAVSRLRRTDRQRTRGDGDPVSVSRLVAAFGPSASELADGLVRKDYLRTTGGGYELRHTFNGAYRRLVSEGTSPTVDTHFGQPRLFLHPSQHRGLSYAEAAALQGFPEDFIWPTSRVNSFRQIGNAVPPLVAQHIAKIARTIL